MKSDPLNNSPLPGEERFVDAALREHSRLGSETNDNSLIERILTETVNRKPIQASIGAHESIAWKSLIIGVASAAAALTVGFFFLQSFQMRDANRTEQEVHFVVRVLDNEVAPIQSSQEPPLLVPKSSKTPIVPIFAKVESTLSPDAALGEYFLETHFGKSFREMPDKAHRHNSFLISADDVSLQETQIRFEGHVVIGHDIWRIEAARAAVPNAGNVEGSTGEASNSLTAFDVVVTQKTPERSVRAGKLSFDAVTGNLVLTDVELLSSANGVMTEFEAGDRLVLTENTFTIENAPDVKFASPELVTPRGN